MQDEANNPASIRKGWSERRYKCQWRPLLSTTAGRLHHLDIGEKTLVNRQAIERGGPV